MPLGNPGILDRNFFSLILKGVIVTFHNLSTSTNKKWTGFVLLFSLF